MSKASFLWHQGSLGFFLWFAPQRQIYACFRFQEFWCPYFLRSFMSLIFADLRKILIEQHVVWTVSSCPACPWLDPWLLPGCIHKIVFCNLSTYRDTWETVSNKLILFLYIFYEVEEKYISFISLLSFLQFDQSNQWTFLNPSGL